MGRKLNTYVHIEGQVYGPDDDLPDEVAKKITNPHVWADGGDEPTAASPEVGGAPTAGGTLTEPPRGGARSGYDAWADYARAKRIEVREGMTREDIIAAVDAAK